MNIKQELRKLTKRKKKNQRRKSSPDKKKGGSLQNFKLKQRSKDAFKKKYYDYLKSKKWAQIKLDLYELRGKQCEVCESKQNVQVHHLTYKNVFKEESKDLVLLCKVCHRKEHKIH